MDFSLQGLVHLRLMHASAHDVETVSASLGPPQQELGDEPDIVLRLDELADLPPLNYLGLNSSAFFAEGFYVLDWQTGRALARIPFDDIGQRCEITCRPQFLSHWLFTDLLVLALLSKNYIPLHASAFVYNGAGILATGWEKGGKTETLLAFAKHNATYVGDEWVVISPDGRTMFGLPMRITIWNWQFEFIRHLLPRIPLGKRMVFRSIHALESTHRFLQNGYWRNSLPVEMLGNALPSARRQLKIKEFPQTLFGDRQCQSVTPLDKILLVVSRESSQLEVEPCDPREVAQRMMHSNGYEFLRTLEYYKAFRFAFPDRGNRFLDELDARQSSLLASALHNKQTYKVVHPYPVSLDDLFDLLRPICGPAAGGQSTPVVPRAIRPENGSPRGSRANSSDPVVRNGAFTVALVGGDGSGKTTVRQRLIESPPVPLRYVYMGTSIPSSNFALPTSRLIHYLKSRSYKKKAAKRGAASPDVVPTHELQAQSPKRGKLGAAFRALHRIAEASYRQLIVWCYLSRGYVVLCERHFTFEFAVQRTSSERGHKRLGERLHLWFLERRYPQPDLVIFLHAPSEVLFERKQEIPVDQLEAYQNAVLELGKSTRNFYRVDANRPITAVCSDVASHIQEFDASRGPHRIEKPDFGLARPPRSNGRKFREREGNGFDQPRESENGKID